MIADQIARLWKLRKAVSLPAIHLPAAPTGSTTTNPSCYLSTRFICYPSPRSDSVPPPPTHPRKPTVACGQRGFPRGASEFFESSGRAGPDHDRASPGTVCGGYRTAQVHHGVPCLWGTRLACRVGGWKRSNVLTFNVETFERCAAPGARACAVLRSNHDECPGRAPRTARCAGEGPASAGETPSRG
jgi:hypothetical protein